MFSSISHQARAGLIGLLGGLMITVGGEAKVVSGVRFNPTCECGDQELELRGAGLLRFMGWVKVTASALYLPPDVDSTRILDDVPKCLEMEYYRDISAEDLVRSGSAYLRKNLTEEQLADIADEVDQINRLYRDVRQGDRYTLAYHPGRGTQLRLNGTTLGTIPGSAFGKYYFSIWLGDEPVSAAMREELLALR